MKNSYVIGKIKKYAKLQLCSFETLETAVMTGLLLFTAVVVIPKAEGTGFLVATVLLVVFAGITAFGLYETLPSLIRFIDPYQSDFIRKQGGSEQRRTYVEKIDAEVLSGLSFDNCDMGVTEHYIVLHGVRTFEVISKENIASIACKTYPHRKKYKGRYFLYFNTVDGKKHTLDVHSGKMYNPEGQSRDITEYLGNEMNVSVKRQ